MLDLRLNGHGPKTLICRAVFASSLAFAFACSEAERETIDRLDDYDKTVWTSDDDCDELVADAGPRPPRVGTWNIRYFPDSSEGPQSDANKATDVPWLACAITSLGVDVLAVQEFKTTPEATEKQRELIELLNTRTGGDWQVELAGCEPTEVQHPGFLYDAARVTGQHFREVPLLNPRPECSNDASPGLAGYFSIKGGPDFHFVAVHYQAGTNANAVDGRAHAVSVMPEVAAEAQALAADTDILFAGDFNTSGCDDCSPVLTSDEEITTVVDQFDDPAHPLRLIPASEDCSREDDSNSQLLDHFAASDAMQELASDAVARVSGICDETNCERLREWHEDARERLSDHCPLTVDLSAADED